jgi:DNA primase
MPGYFDDDLKRRVREANNIVDVVQSAVGKLVRAGRNLKCCCPFHNEKTPSFNVNAEGQYFKCFGCGKSGDIFTFVMLHERVEFPEALKILADRAGIIVQTDPKALEQYKKETDWKSYLYKLNDVACRFYREQLFTDAGKAAREYLKKRGLNDEMCEQFRIGYAPSGGSPLLARLQSQGAPMKAVLASGLASQREDGTTRDFFFDRLMFPITDIQSRVIAFGGRVLGDGEPKYLNTRDTPLFSKTRTVYAIDHARDEIVKVRKAILVEGYTDVMMCHQFGITNVVACLGTAITSDHVRQLRRVADELLLLTDSDAAGAKASERSLAVIFAEEMPARVGRLPGNDKDPCDFLLAHGKDAFTSGIAHSQDLFDYKFEMVRKSHDLLKPMGIKAAAQELMELISLIPDAFLKNRYRSEISKRLNIEERELQYSAHTSSVSAGISDDDRMSAEIGTVPPPENELAKLERELLRFLFHEPAWLETALAEIDLATLSGKPEGLLGRLILEALGDGKLPPDAEAIAAGGPGSAVTAELLKRIPDTPEGDSARSLCIALAEGTPQGVKLEAGVRLNMVIRPIRKASLYLRHEEANRRLTNARLNGDAKDADDAYRQVVQLRKAIAELKS